MYCGTCGKELPDGAKFCNGCGAAQSETATTEPKTTPVVNQTTLPTAEKPEKKKKKVNKKLLAVVAVVLVVAVVAAIVISALFRSNDTSAVSKNHGTVTIYVCVEEIHYSHNDKGTSRIVREYDDVGNLLREEFDQSSAPSKPCDGIVDYYNEWEYDEKDNITRYISTGTYGHTYLFSTEYEYDENGQITEFTLEIEQLGGDYFKEITYKCEYDNNDRLIRVYIPGGFYGNDFTAHLYEYDKDGCLATAYISSDDYTSRYDLDYREGRLSQIKEYECPTRDFQNGNDSTFVFNRVVEYQYDNDGSLKGNDNSKYTYDEHGNIIEIDCSPAFRTVYKYEKREVTAQQALAFCRRNGRSIFTDHRGGILYIVKHLVPNPLEE